jgi:hypothetical protein
MSRNLTDEDVQAIVSGLKKELLEDLYVEAGKGLIGWMKKGLFVLLLILAVYGILGDKALLRHAALAAGGK